MSDEIRNSSIPAFIDECATALKRATAYKVRIDTRFATYMTTLREIALLPHPRVVNRRDNQELQRDRIYREATVQFHQLNVSTRVWGNQDPDVLSQKLQSVFSGPILPAPGDDWDPARNSLLELVTAAMLARYGMTAELTRDSADIIVKIPGWEEVLAVEVKRPTSVSAIQKNLKKARKQLRERCKVPGRIGMAVMGFDRTSALARGNASISSTHLSGALDKFMRDETAKLYQLAQRADMKLFPTTPFVAGMLVGTVYLEDVGRPTFVGKLAVRPTAPNDDLDRDRIERMALQLRSASSFD